MVKKKTEPIRSPKKGTFRKKLTDRSGEIHLRLNPVVYHKKRVLSDETPDRSGENSLKLDCRSGKEASKRRKSKYGIPRPIQAIRDKCLDCCSGSRGEVAECHIEKCPLWSFRFGRNPREKDLIVREYAYDAKQNKDVVIEEHEYPGYHKTAEKELSDKLAGGRDV